MKPLTNYPVKIIATGFVVLVFFVLSLFWIKFTLQMNLLEIMPQDSKDVSIKPSGLLPERIENDPNVVRRSRVSTRMHSTLPPLSLGIVDYFSTRLPGGQYSNVYHYKSEDELMYFDKKTGQIVCHHTYYDRRPDNSKFKKTEQLYAGPEGLSSTSEQNLGRFDEPIIDRTSFYWNQDQPLELIIYDKKIKRFFKIDFNKKTVTKGPDLKQDKLHNPIQIGQLNKNAFMIPNLNWEPPYIDLNKEITGINTRDVMTPYSYDNNLQRNLRPFIPPKAYFFFGQYLNVLDETRRIDLLDRTTLEFVGFAGELPNPRTLFSSRRPPKVKPRDLLNYNVQALYYKGLDEEESEQSTPEYLGLFAASVSRNGTSLALKVFNEKGNQVNSNQTTINVPSKNRANFVPSSKAIYFEPPWSSTLTTIIYLAENLHPPILSIASLFTASSFEAGAGQRALFLLPNSFAAMAARDIEGNIIERFSTALSLMVPAIILAIILARRISKDAFVAGLTKKERLVWIILTLAFGPAAYITYRLTKPKITLVTCQNCGKPRRPDMDKCHRCKSGWFVPELTPPAWRVLGS